VIFGTRFILAPQTIGPINSSALAPLVHYALRRADFICAREGFTHDYLTTKAGVEPSRIVRTTDIAFEHAAVDTGAGNAILSDLGIREGEKFISATVVDWYFPFSGDPAETRIRYRRDIVAALRSIHDRTGLRMLLLNQVSTDLGLAKEVGGQTQPWLIVDEADRSPSEMRAMIQRSEALLGSRFHSCVFALLGGVPTFALAYSYKSTGIMVDLGLDDRVVDITGFDPLVVADMIVHLVENREAESARIQAAIDQRPFPRFAAVLHERASFL
jgi:colanic acid/amylovoran biosynthesis protein